MKAVTCELCGGNDLVKDGGMFVCQHCGTKYTVEEARKLIVEGPVSVEGVASTKNLLMRAQEFERNNNVDKAEEYYNRVLDLDPRNAEAKRAMKRLEKVITAPNLTVEFLPANSGVTTSIIFVDGDIIGGIDAGQTKQFTLQYGGHKIGAGSPRCKNPFPVFITRDKKYRMEITAHALSTSFRVMSC